MGDLLSFNDKAAQASTSLTWAIASLVHFANFAFPHIFVIIIILLLFNNRVLYSGYQKYILKRVEKSVSAFCLLAFSSGRLKPLDLNGFTTFYCFLNQSSYVKCNVHKAIDTGLLIYGLVSSPLDGPVPSNA